MQKERTHPIKRSFTVTSIGYSKLNYLETGHPKSEKTFTNFKFDYALPYWNLFTSGRYTFLPLEKKNTNEELTFVDLDLHSAFRIPGVSFPWRLNLAAGIFYNNILKNISTVGYKDLIGAELKPSLQRSFRKGNLALFYLKYATDKKGAGLAWYHQLPNHHPLVFMLDYEKIKTEFNSLKIFNQALHFNIGYGW